MGPRAQVLAEARVRLVAGLKRYFHEKRAQGLLTGRGILVLDHACDAAMDASSDPLLIWAIVERCPLNPKTLKLRIVTVKNDVMVDVKPCAALFRPALLWRSHRMCISLLAALPGGHGCANIMHHAPAALPLRWMSIAVQ